ncbi:hypothetical protein GCM10027075_34360 [Streptomyces heilongjiangensis]
MTRSPIPSGAGPGEPYGTARTASSTVRAVPYAGPDCSRYCCGGAAGGGVWPCGGGYGPPGAGWPGYG